MKAETKTAIALMATMMLVVANAVSFVQAFAQAAW